MRFADQVLLAFTGFVSGIAVAGGVFGFIVMLGILPRIIGKTRTAKHILLYENFIIAGGVAGCVLEVFPDLSFPVGSWIFVAFGISAGIFQGCITASLAEVLKTFPVVFRRIRLKIGLKWVIFFLAAGKTAGAFYYFLGQMMSQG